jgi:hypothetical protein
MKTMNRIVLGLISSLLLSAGFSKAAQKLDPLTKSIGPVNFEDSLPGACDCIMPCFYEPKAA